jgi:plasmid stabilization system protein ParE
MSKYSIEIHPDAEIEAQEAFRWYRERDAAAGAAFLLALDHAIATLAEAPDRFPPYAHGTQRVLLRRFPYALLFRRVDAVIQILAVAHARRRPGYWRKR